MIKFSNQDNLLVERTWKPQLQDNINPELFRDFFDYESIPKIAFNFRQTPLDMPENIWITDTTFRDGQQSTSPFTAKQIVDLYKLMHKLGGKK